MAVAWCHRRTVAQWRRCRTYSLKPSLHAVLDSSSDFLKHNLASQARKECVTKSICQISLWTSEASQRESWLLPAAAPTIVRATTTVDLATIEVTVVSLLKSCLCNFQVNYILTYESKWISSLLLGCTVVCDWDFTLITNPYVNEVTLRRQKPPLKCC